MNELLIGNDDLDYNLMLQSGDSIWSAVIFKEQLQTSKNEVLAFVLEGEYNLGYIKIPNFYYKQSDDGTSMSSDVAKAIFQLRYKNIQGLVVDLQGNGGGSMEEAIDLISLFVDQGPLFQMIDNTGESHVVKDPTRGISYSGPLMILVDGLSASASELMAMTLIEQKRALIVGERTFGKTTAQVIAPIETSEGNYLKYTIEAWYNLHGQSANGLGVKPTIEIPLGPKFKKIQELTFPPIELKFKPLLSSHPIPGLALQEASSMRFQVNPERKKWVKAMGFFSDVFTPDSAFRLTYSNMSSLISYARELEGGFNNDSFRAVALNPDHENLMPAVNNNLSVIEGYHIFMDWLNFLDQ